ncbi:MAG: hypothetical protein GSR85_05270 [Desulfurococcales archaeon]|nr:hypothetical protein [Desulfurococcales archaeon]
MSERIPAGGAYRAAVGLHESLSVEHLRNARSILSTYCSEPGVLCGKALEVVRRASMLVAEARISDLAGKPDYTGIDAGIIKLHSRLIEFYSLYISGLVVTYGEHVLVKALTSLRMEGLTVEPGDIIRMEPERAAGLYLAGLVEPVASNAIKLKPWKTT